VPRIRIRASAGNARERSTSAKTYEAGPTGFGLARALAASGVGCVVAAPGKIERPTQDKVKTDRRDAERLVRLLMVGGLHPVRVPSTEEEALRDLVRAREDVRGDLMRARHRMSKLLLRHEIVFEGPPYQPDRASRTSQARRPLDRPKCPAHAGHFVLPT
jgi:transposase